MQRLQDGNDVSQINTALDAAKADDRPSLIVVPTTIGFGCPAKAGTAGAHGEPLGTDNLTATKAALGMPEESFSVLPEVYEHLQAIAKQGAEKEAAWNKLFEAYQKEYADLAAEWTQWFSKDLPVDVDATPDFWDFPESMATRNTSGTIINRLAKVLPNLVGGSADLAPSTKTLIKDGGDYSAENRAGRNLHFGVREHAMGAISNGMALHGGLHVYCATFFVFSDYMKYAIRLSAMMHLPVTYVLTHDSIGVGEDGPTHQPIEQLAGLRAIPELTVFRPADGPETAAGWLTALTGGKPVCLVLTRQNLKLQEKSGKEACKGGYILSDSKAATPQLLLMGSGSEVEPLMEAQKTLWADGIDARVISMPSMELFNEQSADYKEAVLPNAVRARIAMEAARSQPWYQYTGLDGATVCVDHYGASAPAGTLFKEFGITAEHVVELAKDMVGK